MATRAQTDFFTAVPPPRPENRKAALSQFFTPAPTAEFMAAMFSAPLPRAIGLLDAGAGGAALSGAFIDRWRREAGDGLLNLHAFEVDDTLTPQLRARLAEFKAAGHVATDLRVGDFITLAVTDIRLRRGPRYTHAILNPPYKKIANESTYRAYLRSAGLEAVNLYTGFVAMALELLQPDGELVAIIPRSFCNGPYHKPFRRFLLERAAISRIHLFGARDQAFKGDGVLQENVIIHLRRGAAQRAVQISTSTDDSFADLRITSHPFNRIVFPHDAEAFIHVPTQEDREPLEASAFDHTLASLGIDVSTGPVVDFRLRPHLEQEPTAGSVPLIYPQHLAGGALAWPKPGAKKPNAIRDRAETRRWLFPHGCYAVTKRFSAKEERRRIVATVIEPGALPGEFVGFENKLNVFHIRRQPLPEPLAHGLAVFLNSSIVDSYFRRFNGHTQVNATDLRAMRYPSRVALDALGDWTIALGTLPDQGQIDAQVEALV